MVGYAFIPFFFFFLEAAPALHVSINFLSSSHIKAFQSAKIEIVWVTHLHTHTHRISPTAMINCNELCQHLSQFCSWVSFHWHILSILLSSCPSPLLLLTILLLSVSHPSLLLSLFLPPSHQVSYSPFICYLSFTLLNLFLPAIFSFM